MRIPLTLSRIELFSRFFSWEQKIRTPFSLNFVICRKLPIAIRIFKIPQIYSSLLKSENTLHWLFFLITEICKTVSIYISLKSWNPLNNPLTQAQSRYFVTTFLSSQSSDIHLTQVKLLATLKLLKKTLSKKLLYIIRFNWHQNCRFNSTCDISPLTLFTSLSRGTKG